MSENSFYTQTELLALNFKSLGSSVKVSRKASLYNVDKIEIGSFSRIDDFCILSAGSNGISIGRNVHIAAYTCLIGRSKIKVGDYANLSSRVSIYSSNDDYSGHFMTNPTVDKKYTNVMHENVIIGNHVIIGSGSVVLPGVNLGEGAAIGALSLVNINCRPFEIYAGTPIKRIKSRSRNLLQVQKLKLQNDKN